MSNRDDVSLSVKCSGDTIVVEIKVFEILWNRVSDFEEVNVDFVIRLLVSY